MTHKSKKHHSKHKEYPEKVLPKSDELEHFTSSLPVSSTGKYGLREIKELFFDKKMNNFEIKGLFNIMDKNKDSLIDDSEWSEFYEFYIVDFQGFDGDVDFYLTKDQMKEAVVTSPKFKHIRPQIEEGDNIDLIMHYLDDNKVNMFKYV